MLRLTLCFAFITAIAVAIPADKKNNRNPGSTENNNNNNNNNANNKARTENPRIQVTTPNIDEYDTINDENMTKKIKECENLLSLKDSNESRRNNHKSYVEEIPETTEENFDSEEFNDGFKTVKMEKNGQQKPIRRQ